MKLLIGSSSSKIFHLREFAKYLNKIGIETKVVFDEDFIGGYPNRNLKKWFQSKKKFKKLITDFQPDCVLVDRQRHFGLGVIDEDIPLFVHLRGDYWEEIEVAKKTIYKKFPKSLAIKVWEDIGRKCFQSAYSIIPICQHLENVTKEHYPDKDTFVMYQGIDPDKWYNDKGISLKHPCVGLLQGAVIWDKTKELLTLEKVLNELPHVMFYWVGDGPYRKEITEKLDKYKNFEWLGALEYPDKVRKFLSEIDVYALISGLDMSPLTLLEAQLMRKPVIATNVGGIPELMIDGKTGVLVEKGDSKKITDKILELLENKELAEKMGKEGRVYVENNFNWKKIAEKFSLEMKNRINKK